jgi:uncharacterized membrane protein
MIAGPTLSVISGRACGSPSASFGVASVKARRVGLSTALLGTALLGTALLGTALLGTALLGTALLGTALLGTALLGTALLGIAPQLSAMSAAQCSLRSQFIRSGN